jgi:uncharacterized membrane protein/thiol-disulfide isomerase/thioredoxin
MKKATLSTCVFVWVAIAATFLICLTTLSPALAQTGRVNAVLFYSPTCPHCETVINEHLPPLQDKYGSNLYIIGINTAVPEGVELYRAAIERFQIPEDRMGVPCLIVGETVLVGSLEIPEQFPGIIENGIQQGGIPLPDIPGLAAALEASGQPTSANPGESESTGNPGVETNNAGNSPSLSPLTIWETFSSDLTGNVLSVVVLAGMIGSLIVIGVNFSSPKDTVNITLPDWLIPLLAIIGIGVASYLSFVEVTNTEAVCGPVGDCNTVQQSPYATLFGILPVGVLGVVGYILILGVWLAGKFGPKNWQKITSIILWALALFGVLFSIYLTFLEPFVIGATCAWCLTTAVIMTVIFWASTPPAKLAWGKSSRRGR